MRSCPSALALVALFSVASAAELLTELNIERAQQLFAQHEKVVLLMHVGECERTREFLPTLADVASRISTPVGVLDVKADSSHAWKAAFTQGVPVQLASGIMPDRPVLKAYFRDASRPGERVQQYRGPPTLEAALDWSSAIDEWPGPYDDFAWLDASSVPQPAIPHPTAASGGDAPTPQSSQQRWAGREGAFNGPSFDEAYRHVMGETGRASKDEL